MDNAFMIVAGFAFEKVNTPTFGKPYIFITDLKNQQQRAQLILENGQLIEKVSTFSDALRQNKLTQVIALNQEEIRGELSA